MLEIVRAVENVAGAGGTYGRAQIEESNAMADRCGSDQQADSVAVFGCALRRVASGSVRTVTLD
jgi:hypothetical protein